MDIYTYLTYEQYKELEKQLNRPFETLETTHEEMPGPFYHKSVRLKVGDVTFEFHGPSVRGLNVKPAGAET